MEFIPTTGMALIAAAIVALLTILFSWVVAVFLAQVLLVRHTGHEMPWFGKATFLLVMTLEVFLGLAIVQSLWGAQLGSYTKIAIWTIISFGLLISFRFSSHRPMWKPTWKTSKSVVLVALIMVTGVTTAPRLMEMLGNVTVKPVNGPIKALGRPAGQVYLEVIPWNDELTVGNPTLLGITVENQSGNNISNLQLDLPPQDGFSTEDASARGYGALSPDKKWLPDYFTVKPLSSGDQSFVFRLSYMEDNTGARKSIQQTWRSNVLGPVLEIERRIFTNPPLFKGQEVAVQLFVQNSGGAPAYNLQLTPRIGVDFINGGSPMFMAILGPGEGRMISYRTIAAEAAEGSIFEPPLVVFKDAAHNQYSTVGGNAIASVVNFVCLSPNDCHQQDSLDILRRPPNLTPPPPDSSLMPILYIDPPVLHFQIPPGGNQEIKLTLRHSGNFNMRVNATVSTREGRSDGGFLREFVSNLAVPGGDYAILPVSFSVPNDTSLGDYEGTLVLQLSDGAGQQVGEPYKINMKVEVSTVLIRHSISSPNASVGEEVTIETIVSNVSNQEARVKIYEYIPEGGISILSLDNVPIGVGKGSTGQVYVQEYTLTPLVNNIMKRVIVVSARDADPGVKRLVGEVRYQLADGTEGSASDTVTLKVDSIERESP